MVKNIFKTLDGRIVIIQKPNLPIVGWAVLKLAAMVSDSQAWVDCLNALSTTSLLLWATLEITTGVNYFRKLLGLVVFVATVSHYL